jgi:glutamine cyclotransferase
MEQTNFGFDPLLKKTRKEVANVRQTDRIVPKTVWVTGCIVLRSHLPDQQRPHPGAVLNGIAYGAKTKRLFVTGKLWPRLFEIQPFKPAR